MKPTRFTYVLTILLSLWFLASGQTSANAQLADDPFYEKQTYLKQIGIEEAWKVTNSNTNIIIAVVDTGVELDHPDLKKNLVPGVNLVQPGLMPADDNGHGTNVAGVIAAQGNNDRGISGILWNAKIMPIKALEADGTGGEAKLGEGIRYAVDHGAKIVVLSLGLNKYSDYMSEIISYAEERGVLLVAATGNEGNVVKYPAAYSTVLSVGGMGVDGRVHDRSNRGPELDLVAPWDVFTTAMGHSYEYMDGTSMAAPQVAAVAALVWNKYPWYTPFEIRQLLRQTAENLGDAGWDPETGFGLLRADRALKEPLLADMYEPNQRKDQAKPISVSHRVGAAFSSGTDTDWYYWDSIYDGAMDLRFVMESGVSVQLQYTDANGVLSSRTVAAGQTLTLPVRKGRSYIQLQLSDRNRKNETKYQLITSFGMNADAYEDNDKQYKAFVLPARSQTIKGTFHQWNDTDWFELPIPESGTLGIRLTTDTARMDPVLLVQKQGERSVVYDDGDDGEAESVYLSQVFPGSYYLRVTNVKEYANPVVGEYTLTIEYNARLLDPHEPNNRSYQATTVSMDTVYSGLLDRADDIDWFQFRVDEESLVTIRLNDIPAPASIYMHLYDGTLKPMASSMNATYQADQQLKGRFSPGIYYVRLTTNLPFTDRMYQFQVDAKPLDGGYADIRSHWALPAILTMTKKQIVEGYGDYLFQPDRPITRAEVTAVLSRAFHWSKQRPIQYRDLDPNHWAYEYISKAAQAGVVDGYPDGTFASDQPVSRMEMTAMLARSMNMTGKHRGLLPFTDVDETYWGTGLLKQMKAEGWITGYEDGSFRPDQQATRAEFVAILARILP
ncbi:S8 family serine peptidase [Paenibacillus silviterrae]|uniref:S8 family serine peptidase n=1 Tax=Paenibacillus silviterrae TaxID=3242194 RepID=UPI002543BCD8|nr:S8 family serine peptidase [Paenibacillus chinjuensis]